MKQLPVEVFTRIFTLLHQETKVECMLVCRQWRDIIQSACLFHTLCITSERNLLHLLRRLEREPIQRRNVKRLVVDTNSGLLPNLKQLLHLLPNLRVLLLSGRVHGGGLGSDIVFPFCQYISHISDISNSPIARDLLLVNSCPNLTTLLINCKEINLINIINNAPALRNLTLCNGTVTINQVENLHTTLTRLQTFNLEYMEITEVNSIQNTTVQPAPLVTTFTFYGSIPRLVQNQALREAPDSIFWIYISRKYTNLIELKYQFIDIYHHRYFPPSQPPLTLSPYLKKINTGQFFINSTLLGMLDNANIQIKHLTLPGYVSAGATQYNTINSVETLTIKFMDFYQVESFEHLRRLKKLKLSGWKYPNITTVHLCSLVNMIPPSLTSLSFENLNVRVAITRGGTSFSQIKSLSFSKCELPKNIDKFISLYFTQLSKLKLLDCYLRNSHFSLPTSDLYLFKTDIGFRPIFDFPTAEMSGKILLVTLCNNERHLFTTRTNFSKSSIRHDFNDSDTSLFPPIKSRLLGDEREYARFRFECNSLKNLIIIQ